MKLETSLGFAGLKIWTEPKQSKERQWKSSSGIHWNVYLSIKYFQGKEFLLIDIVFRQCQLRKINIKISYSLKILPTKPITPFTIFVTIKNHYYNPEEKQS